MDANASNADNIENVENNIFYGLAFPASKPVADAWAAARTMDAPGIEANVRCVFADVKNGIRELKSREQLRAVPPTELAPITSDEFASTFVRTTNVAVKYHADQHGDIVPYWAQDVLEQVRHTSARIDALTIVVRKMDTQGNAMAVEVKAWAGIIDALTKEVKAGAIQVDALSKEMKLTAATTDKRFNVLTAKVTNLTDTVETIKSSLQGMNIKFSNSEARRMNSLATISDDPLIPLVNDAGASPNDFPATRSEFYTLTDDAVAELLEFYGLQFTLGEPRDITQRRLCHFIGMPVQAPH
jgi:hypothetical protein